jgi:hypothetical protein
MAEYIARLWRNHPHDIEVPSVQVNALTEFEAAAVALNTFREMGEEFSANSGLELLQGNVTHSKPVSVKDIVYWLRSRPEGVALVEKDRLQALLEYVPE